MRLSQNICADQKIVDEMILGHSLIINEIFASIQGEASHSGIPCCFVRLTSCPLRCNWCDTKYAYDEGKEHSIAAILQQIEAIGLPVVQLTGGEPLAQEGVIILMRALVAKGYRLLLETSGAVSLKDVPQAVHIIMDIKCPGSGMSHRNLPENLDYLKASDEIKFVISGRMDFDWALEKVKRDGLVDRCHLLFSPVFGVLEPSRLVEWILAAKIECRLNLQIHKYIWEPNKRGV